MNKTVTENKIVWVAVTLVVIIGSLLLLSGAQATSSRAEKETQKSAGMLVVDTPSHDFGVIGIFAGTVQKDFTLTNQGEDAVIILDGTTSCGCTEGTVDGVTFGMHEGMSRTVTIAPGDSMTLIATYDPLAHGPNAVGSVTRQLFLKTNSTETPELEIRISANVVTDAN